IQGDLNDGLDPNKEEVGNLDLNEKYVPIFLESHITEDNKNIWLLSSETTETLIAHIEENNAFYSKSIDTKGVLSSRIKGASVRS
ncbi:MAG: hypothetical protein HKO90_04430, partial [Flavobacteriaceae bacterium]|nr:hypothetical protein [Flavobacteriaceae bacterium]